MPVPGPGAAKTQFKPGNTANPRGVRKDGSPRSPAKWTQLSIAQRKTLAQGAGITPLQFLMSVVCDEAEKMERRIEAAKSAAPYFHRKQPIGIDNGFGGPVELAFDVTALSRLSNAELDTAIEVTQKLCAISAQAAVTVAMQAAAEAAQSDDGDS